MLRTSSLVVVTLALLGACASDEGPGGATDADDRPTIVVTTALLGDVVSNLVGDLFQVAVVMPPGASPHEFEASAQQAAAMRDADVLVVNGGGFEEGLVETIESAQDDGVATFEAMSAIEPLTFGDDHGDDDGDAHEGDDPHFFTDPRRMVQVAESLVSSLAAGRTGVPAAAVDAQAASYLAQLRDLDDAVAERLAPIPPDRRVLVTNHEVFGYFADRYDFEVIGAVIGGGGTQGEPSAAELAELAELIVAEQVPAIFTETSSPAKLAEALADEVGDVAVVELFSESLGAPGSKGSTYLDMMLTNAARIAAALS